MATPAINADSANNNLGGYAEDSGQTLTDMPIPPVPAAETMSRNGG